MSNSCKDCQQPIDWNQIVREKLNTRRPLNPDGTIHSCNGGGRTFRGKAIELSNGSNPTSAEVKTISPTNATVPKIESLNQINFAEILSEILGDYIKLKRQEVGVGKN